MACPATPVVVTKKRFTETMPDYLKAGLTLQVKVQVPCFKDRNSDVSVLVLLQLQWLQ